MEFSQRLPSLLILLLLGVFAVAQSAPPLQEGLEIDSLLFADRFRDGEPAAAEKLRILSYNLHGPPTGRIDRMQDLFQEDPLFQEAHIIALQEANRFHRGSGNRNVARELAALMNMDYVYAVELEHPRGGGQRGLSILSRLPLEKPERVLLPVEGPGGRRRIALKVEVPLGERRLRLYNTHLETRISVENRGRQIQAIIDHARGSESEPVLILGDFNTFSPGAKRKMFELMEDAGYRCPLPGDQTTFQYKFFLRLTLDWIWTRNIPVSDAGVEGRIKASDHRPLWITIDTTAWGEAS